jgi:hypothetical protein
MAITYRENAVFRNGKLAPSTNSAAIRGTARNPTASTGMGVKPPPAGGMARAKPSSGMVPQRPQAAQAAGGMGTTGKPGTIGYTSGPSIASQGRARTDSPGDWRQAIMDTQLDDDVSPGMARSVAVAPNPSSGGMAMPRRTPSGPSLGGTIPARRPSTTTGQSGMAAQGSAVAQRQPVGSGSGMSRTGQPGVTGYTSGPSQATQGRARTATSTPRPGPTVGGTIAGVPSSGNAAQDEQAARFGLGMRGGAYPEMSAPWQRELMAMTVEDEPVSGMARQLNISPNNPGGMLRPASSGMSVAPNRPGGSLQPAPGMTGHGSDVARYEPQGSGMAGGGMGGDYQDALSLALQSSLPDMGSGSGFSYQDPTAGVPEDGGFGADGLYHNPAKYRGAIQSADAALRQLRGEPQDPTYSGATSGIREALRRRRGY